MDVLHPSLPCKERSDHIAPFCFGVCLYQLSFVEHEIVLLDERLEDIGREPPALSEAVSRWDTIPGIDRVARWTLLAEVGHTMAQFPTAEQLASWASLAQVTTKVLANAWAVKRARVVRGCVAWHVKCLGCSANQEHLPVGAIPASGG